MNQILFMDFSNFLVIDNLYLLIKMFMIIGLAMYLVFAVLVIRQVQMMKQSLQGILELPFELMAYIHLVISIAVLLLTIFLL